MNQKKNLQIQQYTGNAAKKIVSSGGNGIFVLFLFATIRAIKTAPEKRFYYFLHS